MARSRRKKTTQDRLIDAALYAAPGPIRTIASNPIGFRILMIGGAILMATGIMTLDWSDGMPHFKINRDKASQVKENLVNDLGQQVQGWNLPNLPGNGNLPGNANPPGYFAQTPSNPYQQPGLPAAAGNPSNQPGWGQNPGQNNGFYNPNNGFYQPNGNPNGGQAFQPSPGSGGYPNGGYPQWPGSQPTYPQSGNPYPPNSRR